MTAFVILAAGRGTRVGRVGANLHKALLPLGERAVLSHLFTLAPISARLIICVGDRAEQIIDYVTLAHPALHVCIVKVPDWDQPGAGPGASLLAAKDTIGDDDFTFTSCDTLWKSNPALHGAPTSWVAVAPIPAGTAPERWCRFELDRNHNVTDVLDKIPDLGNDRVAYVGLAHIKRDDLDLFWDGIRTGEKREEETQVSGGFSRLLLEGRQLRAHQVEWTDTGDEVGYRRAVAEHTGYDWVKTDQATYVLPLEERVVKYIADDDAIDARWSRGALLGDAVPQQIERRTSMLAYRYVQGVTMYERLTWDTSGSMLTRELLEWRDVSFTQPPITAVDDEMIQEAVEEFYFTKTFARIDQLESRPLRLQAADAVRRIDWDDLVRGFKPGIIHGDLNFGNVIVQPGPRFIGIDWREDFATNEWFDTRYDLAKLLAGTVVHWDNARRGDFRPWEDGWTHALMIRKHAGQDAHDVEIIGALSLINSSPLHAPPLDEILVARGTSWLERVL